MRQIIYLFIFFSSFGLKAVAQLKSAEDYVNLALHANPIVTDINNQSAGTSIDSQRVAAGYLPQVTGIANGMYSPYVNGFGYDPVLTNVGALNAMINVSKNFVGKNNLKTQYNAFVLQKDSLLLGRKVAEQEIRKTVVAQYITVWGELQQLAFNKEVIKTLENQEVLLKKLTQSNIYRQTDYLTFLVTLKQQILLSKQLGIQLQNDFATLNYLCGINDTAAPKLGEPDVQLAPLPGAETSVFFRRFKTDSLKLDNEISLVHYSYKPKLSAFANAGYSSSFLYQAYKNFGYSMGLGVTVPIYDGHQKQMLLSKIQLEENTRTAYQAYFQQQYRQQVAQLLQQLSATNGLINDINEQVKYTGGLMQVHSRLLETGDVKIPDYVIAINNYLAAKNLLTQNNVSKLQIINQLNYWNR